MGKIMNIINKLTGADKTSAQLYQEDMEKRQKRFDKILKEKEIRQKMQDECAAVLDECQTTFSNCINVERARAKKKRIDGFAAATEESRIRDAAIGIMIVKEARYKLQSISSESDLNAAMNRLGMALRQIRRLDNSSTCISANTERILENWCPGIVEESSDLSATTLSVPAEVRDQIDDTVISYLLDGHNYENALKMRSFTKPAEKKAAPAAAAQPSSTSAIVDELVKKAYGTSNPAEEPEDISRFKDMI